MPCYDPFNDSDKQPRLVYEDTPETLDELRRLRACMCTILRHSDIYDMAEQVGALSGTPELEQWLHDWWQKHRRDDAGKRAHQ